MIFIECYGKNVYIDDLTSYFNISFGNDAATPLHYAENLYVNNVLTRDISVPSGITAIPAYSFNYFSGVDSVSFPSSVTRINNNAFYHCSNLFFLVSVGIAVGYSPEK